LKNIDSDADLTIYGDGQKTVWHSFGEQRIMKNLTRRDFVKLRGQLIGYLQLHSVSLKVDKRKLEDAAAEDTKKKMMKALSDSDISDLAAYFASLR
jgi:cytochrome c553